MNTYAIAAPAVDTARASLRRFFWLHPEWWTVALCLAAWAVALVQSWRTLQQGAHHFHTFGHEVSGWMLMVVAMMLPLVINSVRTAATDSLWSRRHRAMLGFLVGFFACWLALGLLAAALRRGAWAHTSIAAALAFAGAALWQRTSVHQRALAQCHRTVPLAPSGWKADLDCIRFGAIIGAVCTWSCWPLMLACAFTGHSAIAMVGGMVVGVAERWYYRPRTRTMLAMTLALALYYMVAAIGPSIVIAATAAVATPPEIVGSTATPFSLTYGVTRVELAMHPAADPMLLHAGSQRRVLLNIDKMISGEWSGPWYVYLNVPSNEEPAQHPELVAGELPMYGLVESSRSDEKHKPLGLYEQLEITDLYDRLSALRGWDPKRLTVTFVPKYQSKATIHVEQVTVSMTRR